MSSVDSGSDSSWVVQILFGRYRSWGALNVGHMIILACIGVPMIYIYLSLLRRRFNSYGSELNHIPRSYLPVRKKDLSRALYSRLLNQLVKVDALVERKIEPEKNRYKYQLIQQAAMEDEKGPENGRQWLSNIHESSLKDSSEAAEAKLSNPPIVIIGDPGWGVENTRVANVHFNTSIAKSYYVLEKAALARRPGLRHKFSRSIRDYVLLLRKHFPQLSQELVEKYISTYERAVFGGEKFDYHQYGQFMNILYEMVEMMNEKTLGQLTNSGGRGEINVNGLGE